ncbi:unnamed protein product [Ectocarpus sp. 12 AP-2014]
MTQLTLGCYGCPSSPFDERQQRLNPRLPRVARCRQISHRRRRSTAGASTNRNIIADNIRINANSSSSSDRWTGWELGRSREQTPPPRDAHAPPDASDAADGPQVQLRCRRFHRDPLHVGGA